MDILKRILGYASIGAGKVAARRAWKSDGYIDSAMSSAEAGLWFEAATNLLESGFDNDDEYYEEDYYDPD
jgi:hypothetical protein